MHQRQKWFVVTLFSNLFILFFPEITFIDNGVKKKFVSKRCIGNPM